MTETKPKICFEITDELKERALKAIPRGFNLSEKLRDALVEIMDKLEKNERDLEVKV
jgi:hypothetical protein